MWKMFWTPADLSKNILYSYIFHSAHTLGIKNEQSLALISRIFGNSHQNTYVLANRVEVISSKLDFLLCFAWANQGLSIQYPPIIFIYCKYAGIQYKILISVIDKLCSAESKKYRCEWNFSIKWIYDTRSYVILYKWVNEISKLRQGRNNNGSALMIFVCA